jgi:hypothetical protein
VESLSAPNASLQLLPEAGATQERTLEAVSCKALFGGMRTSTCYGAKKAESSV